MAEKRHKPEMCVKSLGIIALGIHRQGIRGDMGTHNEATL